jgi:hypothetical protein
MLGLLHLSYLHQSNTPRAQVIYCLSNDTEQEFPLAVVSLNITLWTIQVRMRVSDV